MATGLKLTNEEIALAMELRQEGITWKIIGIGLGKTAEAVRTAINYAKRHGLRRI